MYCNEIRPHWLLVTKGYGFTLDDIDWSCPADLEPYAKAYQIERNEKDILQWQLGQYVAAAVSCAFPKGKYPKKPMFQIEEEPEEITERDIQKAILVERQYMAMAINKGLPETIII